MDEEDPLLVEIVDDFLDRGFADFGPVNRRLVGG